MSGLDRGARALLGLGLGLGLAAGCGSSPLTDLEDGFGYVIDAPEGYLDCGVNVRSGLEITNADDASLFVFADTSLADPYTGPLVGLATFRARSLESLPLGRTEPVAIGDTPGRLGAMDGFQLAQLPAGAGTVVTWMIEDKVVQLGGRQLPEADLVALAGEVSLRDGSAVLADGVDGLAELGDIYTQEGQARFLFSVDYELPTPDGRALVDQLTLLGSSGDATSMEAFRFRAATSSRIEVNDLPAVVADISPDGEGPFVVSWLAAPDLVLRLFSFALGPEELSRLAETASRVDGDLWDELTSRPIARGCSGTRR